MTAVGLPLEPARAAVPPTRAQPPLDALAAAADDGVDLPAYLGERIEAGTFGDFLRDTDSAVALAEHGPVFAERLDPLLGRIRDAFDRIPDASLSQADREALAATRERVDTHLGDTGATDQVPGGGLEAHEQAGAHLIDRHVGKSEQQLLDRLRSENISASSSFRDLPSAEHFIAATIAENQAKIDAWVDGKGGNRLVLDGRFDAVTGISVARGDTQASDVHSVKLVLERSDKLGIGYRIVTGYPTTP
jgi:hypothetical protein